jgi:outer membrane protein insertion porin family
MVDPPGQTARYGSWLLLILALVLPPTLSAWAQAQSAEPRSQQPDVARQAAQFIERIDVEGYRRTQISTIRAHIRSRPGDPYNAEAVQRDAQALRDTGYFKEVRLRIEDGVKPNGKIVIFVLIEKPIIRRIEYQGIKSITEADIRKALERNKIALSVESRFDETMLTRAAAVLKELLTEHGHPSATVTPSYERMVSSNAVSIVFNIDEGPKAR